MQSNGMARHFGWEDSATQYLEVYQRAALEAAGGETARVSGTSPR